MAWLANIIGVKKNIIVVAARAFQFATINLIITNKSGVYQTEERCLSLKCVRSCTRYQEIEVYYLNQDFKKQHGNYSGWTAQIIHRLQKHTNLPCGYVMHTVGPVWNGGRNNEEELLTNCYFHSMQLTLGYGIKSIAFPSILTGVYRFPVELAAKIALKTVSRFLENNENSFDLVKWVLFDSVTEETYEAEVDKLYDVLK